MRSLRHIELLVRCFSRLILGLTNGIMAAARTSVRELCGREHVVTGMVYIGGEVRELRWHSAPTRGDKRVDREF